MTGVQTCALPISGNFDGQGLSFGFLQWNFGRGTLQPLLVEMQKQGPKSFEKHFTRVVAGRTVNLAPTIIGVCRMSPEEAVKWCAERQDSGGRFTKAYSHWVAAFRDLGADPGFQAIQRQFARPYMDGAKRYMAKYGFRTERALVLLFDIVVQMGSVTAQSQKRFYGAIADSAHEQDRLVALARAVGPQAGPWEADVLSRKLCIARGYGVVHGRPYNLMNDFGVDDGPVR